jgi:hydrogenase maturation protease
LSTKKTLIAGFGNMLRGDDGFGVEVVNRLGASALPAHIQTMDVGIGGMHFVLRLMEGFEVVIVVDAVNHGNPPGTLHVFTPTETDLGLDSDECIDPHFAEPARSLKFAKALGFLPEQVMVVGCEPESCHLGQCLSLSVSIAVDRAVQTIRYMVDADGQRRAAG